MAGSFDEAVLDWLRANRYSDPALIESVEGRGTDWAGGTESGFYDTFAVDLRWKDAAGKSHFDTVQGEEMESLWRHVVGAWPSGVQVVGEPAHDPADQP